MATVTLLGWRVAVESTVADACLQRQAGRWHYAGAVVLYCSTTPELALLEARVHHRVGTSGYTLQRVSSPVPVESEGVRKVGLRDLPADWNCRKSFTRRLGEAWLTEGRFPMLSVPSSICPEARNVLVNPDLLPMLQIRSLRRCRLDRRLLMTRR